MKRALLLCVALLSACLVAAPAGADRAGASMDTIAARQRFFGKANVDPRTGAVRSDRVILSWFSVSSYAAAFNGHVVFLDAWIAKGSHSDYVPTTREELIALDPEYIFVGHGDFDHAGDLGEVAAGSGATIVGSPEHCDWAKERAGTDLECLNIFPEAAPPGLRKELKLLPGVGISAVTHVHSSFESPEGRVPCIHVWNGKDTADNPPTPDDMRHTLENLQAPRGANILYQFRVGDFSLSWHDTTGKIEEDAPEAAKAIASLPPTDVHSGSVLAFGQVTNCFRSLGQYITALKPKIYTPNHHDNFTFVLGANAKDLEPYVRDEIALLPKELQPKIHYTYDPTDYIKPGLYTYDPNDPRWD